ncbi:hypothetical protein ACAW74_04635 [Fibrella sp. WM1]|uniref:hypothetical protein n=1 Tax=Fibrella musci TaxID=3242485 RepID=UPI0035211742
MAQGYIHQLNSFKTSVFHIGKHLIDHRKTVVVRQLGREHPDMRAQNRFAIWRNYTCERRTLSEGQRTSRRSQKLSAVHHGCC